MMGRWGLYTFEVTPGVIRSFSDLSIKGSSETEEKESGGEKYVARKSGKPSEVSLTVQLNAMLGCDVRREAMCLVEEATIGRTAYFYVGSSKLFVTQMMLTEASVSKVVMSPDGTWLSADVKLTLRQCEKRVADVPQQSYDDGGGSGSSGSKKASANTVDVVSSAAPKSGSSSNPTTTTTTRPDFSGVTFDPTTGKVGSASSGTTSSTSSSKTTSSASSASAVAAAKKTTDTAKTASAASKQTANTTTPRSQTVKNSDKISAM